MSILQGSIASVDEAGVRYDNSRYFAFEHIVSATLQTTWLGGSRLVLQDSRSCAHELRISNLAALDLFAAVLRRLEAYRAPHTPPTLPEPLRRGDLALDMWLSSLATASGGAYRAAAWDRSALIATVTEDRAKPEARAAASYVLLTMGDEEAVAHVIRCLRTGAPSPLVLAAVRLSPGGDALVPDYAMHHAAPYLPAADRQVVERAMATRCGPRHGRSADPRIGRTFSAG